MMGIGGLGYAPAPRPSEPIGRRSRAILVVDDDQAILSTVRDILTSEGYSVETASNGAEALGVLDRIEPSVVLLDMRMPVLDGWGFAREMARRQISVPILVMTAARSARSWADEIGATGVVAKPFDVGELLDIVERLQRGDQRDA